MWRWCCHLHIVPNVHNGQRCVRERIEDSQFAMCAMPKLDDERDPARVMGSVETCYDAIRAPNN